jgi:hypothetical protein
MCRIRSTGRLLPVLVCTPTHVQFIHVTYTKSCCAGSGCIAALEAEKFLTEQEGEENPLEHETEAKKSQANSVVPEYRSNPLL